MKTKGNFCFGRQKLKAARKSILIGTLSLPTLLSADPGSHGDGATLRSSAWRWNLRQGLSYRSLGDISFNSGSFSNGALLPPAATGSNPGMPTRIEDLGIGSTTAFADRTYLDGFVFIDSQTANPASFLPGTTGFWGYGSNSQVIGDNLLFSGGSYTTFSDTNSTTASNLGWTDDVEGVSPVLELEVLKTVEGGFSIGAMAGFLFLSEDSANTATNFRAGQTRTGSTFSVSDRYALQGVIPPLTPYTGSFTSPGTAPLIDNIPTERIITATGSTTGTTDFFNLISESLDLDLYTVSLGPVLRYDVEGFFFSSSLGVTLNLVDWDAGFSETLNRREAGTTTTLNTWQASSGGTKILAGLYLQGSVGYQISENWAASLTGRYDWCETLRGSAGPSTFKVDLSGYTVEVGITYTF